MILFTWTKRFPFLFVAVFRGAVFGPRGGRFHLREYFAFKTDRDVVLGAFLDGAVSQGAAAVVVPKRTRLAQIRPEIPEVTKLEDGSELRLHQARVEVVDGFDLAVAVVDGSLQLAEAPLAAAVGGRLFRREEGLFAPSRVEPGRAEIRASPRDHAQQDRRSQ